MLFPLYDENPHKRFPLVTLLLIVVNVLVMVQLSRLSLRPGGQERALAINFEYGFIPARFTKVDQAGPLVIRQEVQVNRQQVQVLEARVSTRPADVYPTILSMMFLHGGWLHLISNMWMLWIFGNNVEDRLGSVVYACYYFLGGIVAVLVHWMTDPSSTMPVIGASGAVAAVLGGYAMTFPWAKVRSLILIPFPIFLDLPALAVLGIWFVLQLISGIGALGAAVGQQNVAFWAHIGGFLAGVVMIPFLGLGRPPSDADWRAENRDLFDYLRSDSPNQR
jgi:membrane associated rhomboid family serine protease